MSEPTSTTGTTRVKRGMAEMLKGGVIMDVVTPEQARIAEDAGAVQTRQDLGGAGTAGRLDRRLLSEPTDGFRHRRRE